MSSTVLVRNHQRSRFIDVLLLRQISRELLLEVFPRQRYELGVHLVDKRVMIRLNETFLRHQGSTDVITFDYREASEPQVLRGEIFVCIDEALVQARRFRTSWQSELVRYVVHGLLHLSGYDDERQQARRTMKRAENRLLNRLASRFVLAKIGRGVGRAFRRQNPKAEGLAKRQR